jgi:hypothetical protein
MFLSAAFLFVFYDLFSFVDHISPKPVLMGFYTPYPGQLAPSLIQPFPSPPKYSPFFPEPFSLT